MRTSRCTVLVMMASIAFQCLLFGQIKTSDDDLPLAATTAIQEMDRTIQAAKKRAIEKLKTAMKAEMQAGKLDRANRINRELVRISEISEDHVLDAPTEKIVGTWKRKDNISYVFDKKGGVSLANNWSGTWQIENKKLIVTLSSANGKKVPTPLKSSYEMPVKKEIGNEAKFVMQGSPEDMTLYRND